MAQLDLGTLVLKYGADITGLKEAVTRVEGELAKSAKAAESMSAKFSQAASATFGAFDGLAGHVATAGAKFNVVGEKLVQIFGDNASASAMKFGATLSDVTGVGEKQFKGLAEGVKTAGAAMTVAATAAGAISTPMLAATAAVVGLVAAFGALNRAVGGGLMGKIASYVKGGFEGLRAAAGDTDAQGEIWLASQDEQTRVGTLSQFNALRDKLAKTGSLEGWEAERFGELSRVLPSRVKDPRGFGAAAPGGGGGFAADLKASLSDGMKEIATLIKPILDGLAPGPSRRDLMKAEAEAAKEAAKLRDELLKGAFAANNLALAQDLASKALTDAGSDIAAMAYELRSSADDPEIQRRLRHAQFGGAAGALSAVGGSLVNAAVSGGGQFGAAAQGAMTGFEAGGPWGAAAGAVTGILANSEAMGSIMDSLNGMFSALEPGLSAIVEAIAPVIEIVEMLVEHLSPIIEVIGVVLAPLFRVLATTFEALAPVLTMVAKIILAVVRAISWVWNAIVGAVAAVVGGITSVLEAILPDSWVSGMRRFTNWLLEQQVDMGKISAAQHAIDSIGKDTKATEEHADATKQATESVRQFSEAMTNLPGGYRIALAQYGSMAPIGAGAGGDITVNVNGVTDPAAVAQAVVAQIERRQIVSGGRLPARQTSVR